MRKIKYGLYQGDYETDPKDGWFHRWVSEGGATAALVENLAGELVAVPWDSLRFIKAPDGFDQDLGEEG